MSETSVVTANDLPFAGNAADLDKLLGTLRSKPMGLTDSEAKRILGTKLMDARKAALYRWTGLVQNDAGRWRLTSKGNEFVHASDAEKKRMLRQMLGEFPLYDEILRWAASQSKPEIRAEELKVKWVTEYAVGEKPNESRIAGAPSTMFSICERAGLGKFVVGRRGAPSRFEFDEQELARYVGCASQISTDPQRNSSAGGEQVQPKPTFRTDMQSRTYRGMIQEIPFPLSNHQVISILLPDEIPSEDESDIKTWFNLLLRRRMRKTTHEDRENG